MKKSVLTVVLLVIFWASFAQPGVLDQSFGNNGKVTIPIPLGDRVHPVDLKLQPDQKILVLVTADTGQSWSNTVNFFKLRASVRATTCERKSQSRNFSCPLFPVGSLLLKK